MSKKQVLGSRPPRKRNSPESPSVAIPGKLKKDSPLAGYQWRPGESGNPAGRPKSSDLKAEVRAFADEADPKVRKTRLRQWLEICDRRARQGSPKHLEMLLAYGWGRPTTPLEHGGAIDLRSVLAAARQRADEVDVARAALPAATSPTDANSGIREAQAAAEARKDDAEQPTKPKPKVELWTN